ncbi:hypothetical protein FJZ31_03025 [Candidatus Poribacteria bacterium]|nr:hypothetical protein [Candidatus Poribacteria bacterium]
MPHDYDSAYKAFYERLFQRWNIPVETQVEVSRRARTIDVVIKCQAQHLQRLKATAFWFFRLINSLELKSPEDPLDLVGYLTIVSRAYGLLAKQESETYQLPQNATITIVCSVRPDKILEDLQAELRFLPTEEPGIYKSEQQIEQRIVVATELEVIEKNYPLLILAKGEKLLAFFEEVVRKGLTEYIEIIFQVGVSLDPETLTEGVRRMREWSPEFKANLERALENLFEFSPESIERIAPFRRALEEARRNASIHASMNARIQEKHEALQLLLESKFGTLSDKLVSQLEAVCDVDELTRLYKLALQAQTLADIGLE